MAEVSQTPSQTEADDPEQDYWLVCLHEVAGCPAILRLIAGVPEDIAAEEYDDRIAILWHYDPEHDGLPQDRDSARMDFFEDVLTEAVEERMKACLAIVETAKGVKTWTLYSDNGTSVAGYVSELGRQNALPIELHRDKDPDWQVYRSRMAKAEEDA